MIIRSAAFGPVTMVPETYSAGLAEHVPCARIDVLDMVEERDKVAVRWLFSGEKDGRPMYLSASATYRFDGARIAED